MTKPTILAADGKPADLTGGVKLLGLAISYPTPWQHPTFLDAGAGDGEMRIVSALSDATIIWIRDGKKDEAQKQLDQLAKLAREELRNSDVEMLGGGSIQEGQLVIQRSATCMFVHGKPQYPAAQPRLVR